MYGFRLGHISLEDLSRLSLVAERQSKIDRFSILFIKSDFTELL